jgi:pantoate--beta-alanine ligase
MRIVHTIAELRRVLAAMPGRTLVPTMGSLHDGHMSLVRIAGSKGRPVVATIFVNRLQFAPSEDFDRYPRSFVRDCELLEAAGCDVLFAPSESEMYPQQQTFKISPPPAIASILEGEVRPGFFGGVCTVVLKLFNIVRPDIAVFGKKDYQQLLVVQDMTRQFALPIEIIGAETVREPSGLAISSRNEYLSAEERAEAPQLLAVLRQIADRIRSGSADHGELERMAARTLEERGWAPEYVAIRRRDNLEAPADGVPLVALAAARLGSTRLIDNLELP